MYLNEERSSDIQNNAGIFYNKKRRYSYDEVYISNESNVYAPVF